MKVGYCVPVVPAMASYRLRVAIPMRHIGCPAVIGTGDPTFFYKHQAGDPDRALDLLHDGRSVVYDVVNNHFGGPPLGDHYRAMCDMATVITAGSEAMAARVKVCTGRDAKVIPDPYENAECAPATVGMGVLWFGHSANVRSLLKHLDALDIPGTDFVVCSNIEQATVRWTRDAEDECLRASAVVCLTSDNPGASENRVVKAIRAGRFVVMPDDCAESWRAFAPYAWIGDVREGIQWALNNREEACNKIAAGQKYIRERFGPMMIGMQWRALFDSILAAETSASRDG